ncbi:type II toxin-antitoxin system RelE/ParE family toxin [Aphanothece sacrum]|uniref:Plasmid stabilization protein n=1 Tax=Aphanothece sacrum FPU1 TaxID=1920663 RepID=A0A401IGF2_APHSA|nr:type II toxin-antitoxin system mRNA interferase toxin, RelE/StbE family [Aphanothece sacrum]GBF80294.1 hypothetical protein AsFPU1_1695 [Aphanothece sacrum FPU1]GBF83700.1 hypothetical protein AsFPU3_0743 [Aphanothece sacrum FPU3]
MRIVWSNKFKRSFRKITKKKTQLKEKIIIALRLLANSPFTPSLKSHKLTGNLDKYWSCSVNYDYRIIFTFGEDMESNETLIILVDIGSHDEVY